MTSTAGFKLFRHGALGSEKPGVVLADGRQLDVAAFGEDFDEGFFTRDGLQRLGAWLDARAAHCPLVSPEARLGSPIARPSKIVCVGLNYRAHAVETGAAIPAEPILFMKATTALCGPNDNLELPRDSVKTDWEVELAVIIGRRAKYVAEADALDYVAGYALHNDYSEREFQLERGGQWDKGKGCDTFAPIGPYLVPAEQVQPQQLELWLNVNGVQNQRASTSDMIFSVSQLISYISRFMTLLPGDVISTGTPSGVGLSHNPPRYLKVGDVVECGIEGLGRAAQRVVAPV
jgi:2-keto-4-pentenoate hydratase/2-oxohepta-3-ene-1,7-dioic acid hydratase in catechol pathway